MRSSGTSSLSVAEAIGLHKHSHRQATGLFLVEGQRELAAATRAGWSFEALFHCPDPKKEPQTPPPCQAAIYPVNAKTFKRLAYREDQYAWVGVAHRQDLALNQLKLSLKPLVLVLDGIEKPGNVGAIFRIAAAAGVDLVFICNSADPYHPNVIRNSLGANFLVPFKESTETEINEWIQKKKLLSLGLHPAAKTCYTQTSLHPGIALVLGSEAKGLSSYWKQSCTQLVSLPMDKKHTTLNSLNVSSTAAIIVYEALRQRQKVSLP